MSFVYIFFIQQMIFCMPEFAVKTAEGVPGTGNLINCFELRYSTQYLRCCEIACQRSAEPTISNY